MLGPIFPDKLDAIVSAVAARFIDEVLPVGMLQCNCHVLGDAETGEALVIDPGDEVERIEEILARHRLKVRAIVSTHAHIDHVGGLARLAQSTGAPVLMHAADLPLYENLEIQAALLGMPTPQATKVDELLKEGDSVRWGRFAAQIFHTPGHSPGSITLYLPGEVVAKNADAHRTGGAAHDAADAVQYDDQDAPRLFAGDTLFAGSIGRTDLWGGSYPQILDSIREKLLVLPDRTIVLPGHGPATTIGKERESNPFLR
jgi:glyoxylase-like metal-dependent hydrolase (beta-lactamase superfamily II)